jgi:L-alanine-DL-glutamate epimerase-like enolase superfamily enzyme
MKITEVNAFRLAYPVKHPYVNSETYNRSRKITVIKVLTDSGLVGWREGSSKPVQYDVQSNVIGKSPFDCEVIYDDLSNGGRNARSVCGVEIALWDLMGKVLQLPVW